MSLPEIIYVSTVFAFILLFIFIAQFVLLFKFKNMNNKKLDDFETRIQDNERLAKSQVEVNNEVIKMTTSINDLIQKQKH